MAGMQLPFWDQVVDLGLNAHRALSKTPVVGWDIALTPDGPVLVEGNVIADIETFQQIMGRPIGESRLPETMVEYFHRWERAGKTEEIQAV